MLFNNVPRTDVTIYNKIGNSYERTVIEGCIWRQNIEASFRSQGALPLDTISLYILNYEGYVSHEDYNGYGGWTVTSGNDKKNTYIVKGVCDYSFDSTDERQLANSIRNFEKTYSYHRANVIKENFEGSPRIRHLVVLC